jgi:hypothetical protein
MWQRSHVRSVLHHATAPIMATYGPRIITDQCRAGAVLQQNDVLPFQSTQASLEAALMLVLLVPLVQQKTSDHSSAERGKSLLAHCKLGSCAEISIMMR